MFEERCAVCGCVESKHITGWEKRHAVLTNRTHVYFAHAPYVYCRSCRRDCAVSVTIEGAEDGKHQEATLHAVSALRTAGGD